MILEKLRERAKELEASLVQTAANHAGLHGAFQEIKSIIQFVESLNLPGDTHKIEEAATAVIDAAEVVESVV